MASFQVIISEQEVNDIIIATIRKKYNITNISLKLEVRWNDDSGATIFSPELPMNQTNWLEEME